MIEAFSADIIATLLSLKVEIEERLETNIYMTIVGATEAHLIAKEIGEAQVGVILLPSRPFPSFWEQQRL